ncbi:MAG: sterol desaturase family protein [Campylobacterota bacterium]|nr:sterol desaturase family protein [Campylobacterota bacterium]
MDFIAIEYFFNAHQRLFWLYILASFLIAFGYILYKREPLSRYFNAQIWWHDSAKTDYIYFVVVTIIKAAVIVPLVLSSKEVALFTAVTLQEFLGYFSPLDWSREAIMVTFSLTLFIVSDLTRYWLHRLMHTIPFLWRFHRVHHSAEVLNPLTFYRVHPVENFLFGLRYALSAGVVTGLFIYVFGARIGLVEIVGVNLFVFIFAMMGSNLRHSHIPLRFPKLMEQWLISPYMHQVHHSKEGTNHNFGGALAIWDRLFKSLHVSEVKTLDFGINIKHNSAWELLSEPLKIKKGNMI